MDVKWFFAVIAILLTASILIGMYFISLNQALQDRSYYQQSQQNANERFDNSTTVHNFLYNAINKTTAKLDPILSQIPNATQAYLQQQIHYNQTAEDFAKIKTVLEIKLQDHKTLNQVNQTVNEILAIVKGGNNDTTGDIPIVDNVTPPRPAPGPLPAPSNNTDDIIIKNVTKDNGTASNDTILILK